MLTRCIPLEPFRPIYHITVRNAITREVVVYHAVNKHVFDVHLNTARDAENNRFIDNWIAGKYEGVYTNLSVETYRDETYDVLGAFPRDTPSEDMAAKLKEFVRVLKELTA